MNISYLDFSLKPAVFGCLTNAIAPPLISQRAVQTLKRFGKVSSLHSKKIFKFFGWGLWIFVSDVINEVVFGPYWLMLCGQRPNC